MSLTRDQTLQLLYDTYADIVLKTATSIQIVIDDFTFIEIHCRRDFNVVLYKNNKWNKSYYTSLPVNTIEEFENDMKRANMPELTKKS